MYIIIAVIVFVLTYGILYVMRNISCELDDGLGGGVSVSVAIFISTSWFIIIPIVLILLLGYGIIKCVEYVIDKWMLIFILKPKGKGKVVC